MKNIFLFLVIVLIFSGCSNDNYNLYYNLKKDEGIYSIKKAQYIDMEKLVENLEHYPVIFVGDHHNTKKTHEFFEALLTKLDKKDYKLNLANEWFTPNHDEILREYTDGKIDIETLRKKREWDKFTIFKWDYVKPLYEAVKKNNGRLYGINLTKEQREKISSNKLDEMNDEEKSFYESLDLNVEAHKKLVIPYLNHCKKMPQKNDEPCEDKMYRVQVAWDSYMAKNVKELSKKLKSSNEKLIVFAGAMHMEHNLGIPLRFARLSNLPFSTISNETILDDSDIKIYISKADFVYIYKNEN